MKGIVIADPIVVVLNVSNLFPPFVFRINLPLLRIIC